MSYSYSNYATYPDTSNRANEEHSLTLLVRAERALLKNEPGGRLRRDTVTEVEDIIRRHSPPRPPPNATIVNSYPPPRPPAPAATNLEPSTHPIPAAQGSELNTQLHHRETMDALQLQRTEIVDALNGINATLESKPTARSSDIKLRHQPNEVVDAVQLQHQEVVDALFNINATLESIRREIREGKRGVGAKLDNLVKQPEEDGDASWSSGCCVVS